MLLGTMMLTSCNSGLADGTYAGKFEETVDGKYNYSAKVHVEVKDATIVKVTLDEDSSIATSATYWKDSTWTAEAEANALKAFEGKKVKDFLKTEPIKVDGVAGATLSSTRLYNAVIDSLKTENKVK